MNTTTKVLLGIAVLIIIVAGAWYAFAHHGTPMPAATTTATDATMQPASGATTATGGTAQTASVTIGGVTATTATKPAPVTITYTNSGFSPNTASFPAGTVVTFVNKSSESMWVASNPHPIHNGYDGTTVSQHCVSGAPVSSNTFDECTAVNAGGTFTFTPTNIGTWGYHNHADHEMTGSITVTAAK